LGVKEIIWDIFFVFSLFSTIMEDSSKTDFSIERFLKEARIEEKDIPRYAEFLKKWGLNGEQDLPRFIQ
jgi:hypothetical protein